MFTIAKCKVVNLISYKLLSCCLAKVVESLQFVIEFYFTIIVFPGQSGDCVRRKLWGNVGCVDQDQISSYSSGDVLINN